MKPSNTTECRVTDAIKRYMRGDTFDRCETECFYGRQYKHDCQKRMMGDMLKMITAQRAENARLRDKLAKYEEGK